MMCKKTSKLLFISGIGVSFIVYYCATYYPKIKIINGGEKGSPLSQLPLVKKDDLLEIQDGSYLRSYQPVFLDNTSGDYYKYNKDKDEWKASGNVGLHHSVLTDTHSIYSKLLK